ncbi:hypothetical protein EYF80_004530 [Liparis tanakae]|uniref:Uncharacterized protein n=1 Tax=Liparis tanakae TaxID=230148 RepID=A0A4Z2J4S5_9TELE|nr:hypothetical protein EYF80_004530 [Liparis tanakae]
MYLHLPKIDTVLPTYYDERHHEELDCLGDAGSRVSASMLVAIRHIGDLLRRYAYTLCPFNQVTQKSTAGTEVSLGQTISQRSRDMAGPPDINLHGGILPLSPEGGEGGTLI